jgi:transposase
LGHPLGFHLTPGQASALEGADALWPGMVEKSDAWLADKASEAQDRVLRRLENAGVQGVSPPKSTRKVQRTDDKDLEKIRHRRENFFAKLKQCRGIATRYDQRATTFLGAISMAATVIWLN